MDSIRDRGEQYFISQGITDKLEEINTQFSSMREIVTRFSHGNNASLFGQSPRDLCDGYGYSISVEKLPEVLNDALLQGHSIKYGYQISEGSLSIINEHKNKFIERIDPILTGLCSSFDFLKDLKELECSYAGITGLMNRICSSFSRCVYDLRPKCIDVLHCDIVPDLIKSVYNSMVIDSVSERKMTYIEMEELFLYFVTSLEKLFMVKAMKYWRDFCNENKSLLSLIPDVNYSDPFSSAYCFDGTSRPNITYPAAFTNKFGSCISFIAVDKISEMMRGFITKCEDVLKKVVRYKCFYICNYSGSVESDLRKLDESLCAGFESLAEREFNKKIVEEEIENKLGVFLNNLVVWNEYGTTGGSRRLIFKNIITYMRSFILDNSVSNARCVIKNFKEGKFSLGNRFSSDWKHKWGFKLHPEDNYKISYIRRRFSYKSGKFIKDKFMEIMKGNYRFSDGTAVGMVSWDKISKNMLPIAQKVIKKLIDKEYEKLHNFLINIRIFDDDVIFDGSSYGTRDATSEERSKIFGISSKCIFDNNEELFSRIWNSLANNSGTSVVISKRPPVSWKHKWGIKLHPEDNYRILSIRKKFSDKSRRIIKNKFCSMMTEQYKFLDGTVIRMVNWDEVSENMLPVIQELVKPLVEAEHLELSKFLLDVRVLDNSGTLDASCLVTRCATSEEREKIFRGSAQYISVRNKELCIDIWKGLVDGTKVDAQGAVDCGTESPTSAKDSTFDSDCKLIDTIDAVVVAPKSNISAGTSLKALGKVSKIIKLWGLNIHPSDCRYILFIRKTFSNKIRNHFIELFSGMLKSGTLLPSGRALSDCSWSVVSGELSEIAMRSADHIIKVQCEELYGFLSKVRVVDVDENDSSCTIREVTDAEKKDLVVRARKIVDKRLKDSLRFSWLYSINKFFPDTECYNEGCHQDEGPVAAGGVCGVDLRYSDNTDILSVRKKYSLEIKSTIYDKFVEMMRIGYQFDDGTVIRKSSWYRASKRLLPIVKKEVKHIFENERRDIEEIVSRSRIAVDMRVSRRLTDEEKFVFLRNIMGRVYASSNVLYRRVWNTVTRLPEFEHIGEADDALGVKLRSIDEIAIFNVRRKFSPSIRKAIHNKFVAMIKSKYMFDDGTFVGAFAWFRVSRVMLPIAKEEVSPIIETEKAELEQVISKSRVVVDCNVDRELTSSEKIAILEKVMGLVYSALKVLSKRVWNRAISCL